MHPTLKEGYKVMISPVRLEDIKTGDLIIVVINNQIICHRFIRSINIGKKLFWFLKGDNVRSLHIALTPDIVGRVTEVLDENTQKVNKRLWSKSEFSISNTSLFIYAIFWQIKMSLFGRKKFSFSSRLARGYWSLINTSKQAQKNPKQ